MGKLKSMDYIFLSLMLYIGYIRRIYNNNSEYFLSHIYIQEKGLLLLKLLFTYMYILFWFTLYVSATVTSFIIFINKYVYMNRVKKKEKLCIQDLFILKFIYTI